MDRSLLSKLSNQGYWPAVASKYLEEGKYSRAIELCMMHLKEHPEILSGRIILARALFHSGQDEEAELQFYDILRRDPNNMIALKYLGDLKYKDGDEAVALSYYNKILHMDPYASGLASSLSGKTIEATKVLTLKKTKTEVEPLPANLRDIPFRTETLADLLMSQGHARLALEVYRELAQSGNPRLVDKFEKAKEALNIGKDKDV